MQNARADIGPCLIQVRDGATPDEAPATLYTIAKWEFIPAVNLTRLLGPMGAPVSVVPFVGEQMINLEVTGETAALIEGSRLMGKSTKTDAQAANSLNLIGAFTDGGAFKNRPALKTALAAIGGGTLAANATPSAYELRLTVTTASDDGKLPMVSGALWRISPRPTLIATTTEVFGTALGATDFASFYNDAAGAAVGDTAKVLFSVDAPTRRAIEWTWDDPKVPLTKIIALSGRESGNVFTTLEADNCVAIDPTYGQERAVPSAIATSYLVLGAGAILRQTDYAEALPGVPNIV